MALYHRRDRPPSKCAAAIAATSARDRRLVLANHAVPDLARQYSGYVGWRGTVREDLVSDETRAILADALTYSLGPNTQAVMYTIPGMTM